MTSMLVEEPNDPIALKFYTPVLDYGAYFHHQEFVNHYPEGGGIQQVLTRTINLLTYNDIYDIGSDDPVLLSDVFECPDEECDGPYDEFLTTLRQLAKRAWTEEVLICNATGTGERRPEHIVLTIDTNRLLTKSYAEWWELRDELQTAIKRHEGATE